MKHTTTNDTVIKPILHKIVELGLKEGKVVKAAKINAATWSRIRNGKSGLKIEHLTSICEELGLEIKITDKE